METNFTSIFDHDKVPKKIINSPVRVPVPKEEVDPVTSRDIYLIGDLLTGCLADDQFFRITHTKYLRRPHKNENQFVHNPCYRANIYDKSNKIVRSYWVEAIGSTSVGSDRDFVFEPPLGD